MKSLQSMSDLTTGNAILTCLWIQRIVGRVAIVLATGNGRMKE